MTPVIDILPLIEDALNTLRNQTGLEAMVEPGKDPDARPMADAVVIVKRGARTWRFGVKVRPWLNRTILSLLKERLREDMREWLLITRCVTVGQANELREMHLAFLDTAGNAFLEGEELYVFIKGLKAEGRETTRKADLFRPAELKVLFAFLCQRGLEAKTHEEIRQMTGVGLGTINRLIRALETAGYIIKLKGRARRLVRRKELLDQWAIAYPQRLRPKQMIGRFIGHPGTRWADVDPAAFDAQWGGEIAAKYLTQYLKPQTATLYVTRQANDLIVKQKLRRDPRGDIEILKRFWNFPNLKERDKIVPPLLVYADLMATGDERNIETARMIYDGELAGLVGEG